MALLDNVLMKASPLYSFVWAGGQEGSILPTLGVQHVFVKTEHLEELHLRSARLLEESPVVARGFMSFWLQHRTPRNSVAFALNMITQARNGYTPKEIYDLYIEDKKSFYLNIQRERPDAWKMPDPERFFYQNMISCEIEEEFIDQSIDSLKEYLDEEDLQEMQDIKRNFLDYLNYILQPYQRPKQQKPMIARESSAYVTSVFIPTYRLCEMQIDTYPEVVRAFTHCIDPNEAAQVPVFIEACIALGCAREAARLAPKKIVMALIDLGVLSFASETETKRFIDNVGRKLGRLADNHFELSDEDQMIYDMVINLLTRPAALD